MFPIVIEELEFIQLLNEKRQDSNSKTNAANLAFIEFANEHPEISGAELWDLFVPLYNAFVAWGKVQMLQELQP